jgi:hypothetical protein
VPLAKDAHPLEGDGRGIANLRQQQQHVITASSDQASN